MDIWEKLYNEALQVQNARVISPFIEAGGVAAALLTKAGNIYVGVCIDTASTLGMCAERNAIANMITNGENEIRRVLAIMPEEERYWAVRTKYSVRQPDDLWDFPGTEYPYYRGYLLGPDDRAVDITGDESLMMVKLSGHTDGQAGILIRNGSRYVLLAADAAYSADNWQTMTPPGLGADRGSQLRSLKWLSKTAADPSCVKVLCSHDPEVRPGVIEI